MKRIRSDCAGEGAEDIGGCERERESGNRPFSWLCFARRMISILLLFTLRELNGWDGIGKRLISPAMVKVTSPISAKEEDQEQMEGTSTPSCHPLHI